MQLLATARYQARFAETPAELAAAQALRYRCFLGQRGLARAEARDADGFDAQCRHVLVEDRGSGALLGCYRVQLFADGQSLSRSYAAQVYGLQALEPFAGAKLELGRFCIAPEVADPDVLRLAWAAMTRIVDQAAVGLLFGCSSFAGCDWQAHRAGLALLRGHLGPVQLRPTPIAAEICRYAEALADQPFDPRDALHSLPPLLRTYLGMGGWVSDHAVIDRALDTLHVFTAVEIARIPPGRARALRQLAASD